MVIAGITYSQADKVDIVVASDGSGDYTKVNEAIKVSSSKGKVIFLKAGTYKEQLRMTSANKGLKLIGESYEKVRITFGDDGDASGLKGNHATLIVTAEDFYAENITIEQTFDSRKGKRQAEALSVRADRAVFYKCLITGFQDTYRIKGIYRAYHKECIIDGTTDFIYGRGIGLFEDCTIRTRINSHITAHAQSASDKAKYGLVFINCKITNHPDEKPVTSADMGRPWGNRAKVVFLKCDLGDHIKPEGWSTWNSLPNNHKTAYYAEYKNFGPSATPEKRASWSHQLTDTEAEEYTKEKIFKASASGGSCTGDWNPVIEHSTAVQHSRVQSAKASQAKLYTLSEKKLKLLTSGIKNIEIQIFTLDGALVLRKKLESATGLGNVTIPVGNLKSGIYLIQSKIDNAVRIENISVF